MSLDLYAKIEPYIGFYEHYERLYGFYMKILSEFEINNILDVGCGNGRMLEHLQQSYDARGIDLSAKMVEIARKRGVLAEQKNISQVKEKYDAIVAVADVLNYMDAKSLKRFLKYIKNALKKDGIFICDINSKYGFCDVADGTMIKEDSEIFLAIDAIFDGKILDTNITFFEKEDEMYKKYSGSILQYYHSNKEIIEYTPMEIVDKKQISLFSEKPDKIIYTFSNKV